MARIVFLHCVYGFSFHISICSHVYSISTIAFGIMERNSKRKTFVCAEVTRSILWSDNVISIHFLNSATAAVVFIFSILLLFTIFNFYLLPHNLPSSFKLGSSCFLGFSTGDVWYLAILLHLCYLLEVHFKVLRCLISTPEPSRISRNWKIWSV